MAKSNISWTDEVWNPVTGCAKTSSGCLNCYAEVMHNRLKAMGQKKYQQDFHTIICHDEELKRKFRRKPLKIFVNSMSDLFHENVPDEFIEQVLEVIKNNPQHIFQILTKRSYRLPHFFNDIYKAKIPSNLWLGVSIENQYCIPRMNDLKRIKVIKFISFEPLLEDIGLLNLDDIDWVIIGCESGHNSRLCKIEWIERIVAQCIGQNVSVFVKQAKINNKLVEMPKIFGTVWEEYPYGY